MRNFFRYLKENQQFASKELILIGNPLWKDLAVHYDGVLFDRFIWVSLPKYKNNLTYRIKTILKLRALRLDTVMSLIHSRTNAHDELVLLSGAKEKWSSSGDAVNNSVHGKEINDRLFDKLIPTSNNLQFEFFRNKLLFENLINEKINIERPFFKTDVVTEKKNWIGFFIGAADTFRKWSTDNYIILAENLLKKFEHFQIVIFGGKGDMENGVKIAEHLKTEKKIIDFTGKTGLTDLITLTACCQLLITHDSAGLHIGAAVNVPAVCLSNGNHFGRFNPYPDLPGNKIRTIYPDESFYLPENYYDYCKKYQYISNMDINIITPEEVFETCLTLINTKQNTPKSQS